MTLDEIDTGYDPMNEQVMTGRRGMLNGEIQLSGFFNRSLIKRSLKIRLKNSLLCVLININLLYQFELCISYYRSTL